MTRPLMGGSFAGVTLRKRPEISIITHRCIFVKQFLQKILYKNFPAILCNLYIAFVKIFCYTYFRK